MNTIMALNYYFKAAISEMLFDAAKESIADTK